MPTLTGGPDDTGEARDGRLLAWAVLVAALLQVIAPLITLNGPGGSPADGAGPDLLITPVGWAFSIWGVIYTLAIAQAVAVLLTGSQRIRPRLQVAQVVLYLGATGWIALAGLDRSIATAAALAVMSAAAIDAVVTVARNSLTPKWLAALTRTAVGLYAGWVTAAFFLNVSTALVDAGAFEADELTWQLSMLVLAVAALLAVAIAARGTLAYTAAGIWALVGIGVTGRIDGTGEVVVAAAVSIVLLCSATVAVRVARRRNGPRGGRLPEPARRGLRPR